jgi:uncharacterized protein
MTTVRDRQAMIAGMRPELVPGLWQFCTLTDPAQIDRAVAHALATFREAEGLSVILPQEAAVSHGLPLTAPMRQITLQVFSSLEGVGLTAAVASALADHGIACNMVAGYHHDHAFVPSADADRAVEVLQALAAGISPATGT